MDLSHHNSLAIHLTDFAFNCFVNKQVDAKDKNYLQPDIGSINISKFNLPEKFVVITTGFTAEVREMLPEYINNISDYVISKGYTPVFLGNRQIEDGYIHKIVGNFKKEIDYTKGLDLIGQTTLVEALKIISLSKVIVGLDNGLLHVAGMCQVPIIGGFTTVESKYRMPYRKNELGWNYYPVELTTQELACVGCQSNMTFTYKDETNKKTHDFKFCYYGDTLCKKLLTADKYISQLEKILC